MENHWHWQLVGFHEAVQTVGRTKAEVEHIGMDEGNIPKAVHAVVRREPEEAHRDSELEFETRGVDSFQHRQVQQNLQDL